MGDAVYFLTMTRQPEEVRKFKRNLSTARREMTRAVERFAEIDPRPGHKAEAVRLAREIREEADRLVTLLRKDES